VYIWIDLDHSIQQLLTADVEVVSDIMACALKQSIICSAGKVQMFFKIIELMSFLEAMQ
jgi:hypothetical protein